MAIKKENIATILDAQALAPLTNGNRQLATQLKIDTLLMVFQQQLQQFLQADNSIIALVVQQCTTKGSTQEGTLVMLIPHQDFPNYQAILNVLGQTKQLGVTIFRLNNNANTVYMKKIKGGKTIGLLNWINQFAQQRQLDAQFIAQKKVKGYVAPMD